MHCIAAVLHYIDKDNFVDLLEEASDLRLVPIPGATRFTGTLEPVVNFKVALNALGTLSCTKLAPSGASASDPGASGLRPRFLKVSWPWELLQCAVETGSGLQASSVEHRSLSFVLRSHRH